VHGPWTNLASLGASRSWRPLTLQRVWTDTERSEVERSDSDTIDNGTLNYPGCLRVSMGLIESLESLPAKDRRLPKVFKAKWVAHLRSGDFKQGKNSLFTSDTGRYCCLGVACEIAGAATGNMNLKGLPKHLKDNEALPERLPGLLKHGDTANNCLTGVLSQANDNGSSFEEIAHAIERYC